MRTCLSSRMNEHGFPSEPQMSDMSKDKNTQSKALLWTAQIGEIIVLLSAAAWILQPRWAGWFLAVGAVAFAIGRIFGEQGDYALSMDKSMDFQLRRLYRQRLFGVIILLLAAILINTPNGFYSFFGLTRPVFYRSSLWLMPFSIFVVFELYTAFRIPAVEKKLKKS